MQTYLRLTPLNVQISKNSVLDNNNENIWLEYQNSLLYLTYKLFNIDLLNLIKVKALLSKQFSIAPSEVDKMAYWEYEYFMKEINDLVKEENETQKKQYTETEEKYNIKNLQRGMNNPMRNNSMTQQANNTFKSIPRNINIKTNL